VVDPAGGSWYVERLTTEVAEAAWALFQRVEAGGGMRAWLERGEVARVLGESWTGLRRGLATRRAPITGVSSYPLLDQKPVDRPAVDWRSIRARARARLEGCRGRAGDELARVAEARRARRAGGELVDLAIAAAAAGATLGELRRALVREATTTRLRPLPVHREAEEYEVLRAASDRHFAATGRRPRAHLACLGPPAEHRARAGFARGLLAAGGFEAEGGGAAASAASAVDAFAASGAGIAVICASDALYPTVVPELARGLKGAGARAVVLAGHGGEHEAEWRGAGVDRFVYLGCDVLAELAALHDAAGVGHE
jgi:methylmalonyl-CoA mutase